MQAYWSASYTMDAGSVPSKEAAALAGKGAIFPDRTNGGNRGAVFHQSKNSSAQTMAAGMKNIKQVKMPKKIVTKMNPKSRWGALTGCIISITASPIRAPPMSKHRRPVSTQRKKENFSTQECSDRHIIACSNGWLPQRLEIEVLNFSSGAGRRLY